MSIVYQLDKRSGITYAYESNAFWDKEKKQSRSKRRLIGKVLEDGSIVPTDGRCAHLKDDGPIYKKYSSYSKRELIDEVVRLKKKCKEKL